MATALRGFLFLASVGAGLGSAFWISSCSQPTRSEPAVTSASSTSMEKTSASADTIVDPADSGSFSDLLSDLAGKRVVFVGETHDRYDHHLNQLAVIRGLHERGADLAVGLEVFQEPFQRFLDQYVAGEIGEKELLKKTEYYERWRFDFRLYRDILTYARETDIPLVALNAPTEIVGKVSKNGLRGLTPEDRSALPADLAAPDSAYGSRLRPVFEMHGRASDERFRRFVEVQLLWDEHMARSARDYLTANPEKTLVILAGSGHVAYPDAIPGRLARMTGEDHAVVVTGSADQYPDGRFDYVLAERNVELSRPGRMGMMFETERAGVTIQEMSPNSPAARAGLLPGDRVLSIAGERIRGMDDIRLALLDRSPGEQVWIEVARGTSGADEQRLGQALTLM